jgi:hypothetical protein
MSVRRMICVKCSERYYKTDKSEDKSKKISKYCENNY